MRENAQSLAVLKNTCFEQDSGVDLEALLLLEAQPDVSEPGPALLRAVKAAAENRGSGVNSNVAARKLPKGKRISRQDNIRHQIPQQEGGWRRLSRRPEGGTSSGGGGWMDMTADPGSGCRVGDDDWPWVLLTDTPGSLSR